MSESAGRVKLAHDNVWWQANILIFRCLYEVQEDKVFCFNGSKSCSNLFSS